MEEIWVSKRHKCWLRASVSMRSQPTHGYILSISKLNIAKIITFHTIKGVAAVMTRWYVSYHCHEYSSHTIIITNAQNNNN